MPILRDPAPTSVRPAASHPSRQRGASLIEIVIATLILSIVAIGMAEFFSRGRVGLDHEERKRVAVLLAQEALERTVARGYDQVVGWSETRTVGVVDYTVTVTEQTDVPAVKMKTVRAIVAWDVNASDARSAVLTTLVYDL